jgi:hypothetical protein
LLLTPLAGSETGGPAKHQLPEPQQHKRAKTSDAYTGRARQVCTPVGAQHFHTTALGIRNIYTAAASPTLARRWPETGGPAKHLLPEPQQGKRAQKRAISSEEGTLQVDLVHDTDKLNPKSVLSHLQPQQPIRLTAAFKVSGKLGEQEWIELQQIYDEFDDNQLNLFMTSLLVDFMDHVDALDNMFPVDASVDIHTLRTFTLQRNAYDYANKLAEK